MGAAGGFLPPEPSGPEPELRDAPSPPPTPAPASHAGWQPPAASEWQQPPPPALTWPYAPPAEPDNGAAVAGFVTSLVAGSLLIFTAGFAGFLTLIAAPFGIHYSRKGKRAVAEGRSTKHAGLAQAGFVIGIITLVLSAIAVIAAIVFAILLATDSQFRQNFENPDGGGGGGGGGGFNSTSALAGLALLRLAVGLVA